MARLLRWSSSLLIAVGLVLVGLAVASYGYAAVERYRAEQQFAELRGGDADSVAEEMLAAGPQVLPRGEAPAPGAATTEPDPEVTLAPEITVATPEVARVGASRRLAPTQPRSYPPAVRMKIPSAGIDARVVEVGIVSGEFEVPKFVVGHYRDTANPGQRGNGVFAGHVSSISSGNVFATLDRAKVGDDILLFTATGPVRYVVSEVRVVPRTYVEAMDPTPDPAITLIACTGRWDWRLRDYLERLIVRAELAPEQPAS